MQWDLRDMTKVLALRARTPRTDVSPTHRSTMTNISSRWFFSSHTDHRSHARNDEYASSDVLAVLYSRREDSYIGYVWRHEEYEARLRYFWFVSSSCSPFPTWDIESSQLPTDWALEEVETEEIHLWMRREDPRDSEPNIPLKEESSSSIESEVFVSIVHIISRPISMYRYCRQHYKGILILLNKSGSKRIREWSDYPISSQGVVVLSFFVEATFSTISDSNVGTFSSECILLWNMDCLAHLMGPAWRGKNFASGFAHSDNVRRHLEASSTLSAQTCNGTCLSITWISKNLSSFGRSLLFVTAFKSFKSIRNLGTVASADL